MMGKTKLPEPTKQVPVPQQDDPGLIEVRRRAQADADARKGSTDSLALAGPAGDTKPTGVSKKTLMGSLT